jgi:hypothetical protein
MIYRRHRRRAPRRIETREEYMRRMRAWVLWMIQQCAEEIDAVLK